MYDTLSKVSYVWDLEEKKVEEMFLNSSFRAKSHNRGTVFIGGSHYIIPRAFNIERTAVFIFSFNIGLVTKLNGSALEVLKHHYFPKRIREL